MKAYIERPISEKPEYMGKYTVMDDRGTAASRYFINGDWTEWHSSITHWLQPVELPQGNAEVLKAALEKSIEKYEAKPSPQVTGNVQILIDALIDLSNPGADYTIAQKALYVYDSSKPTGVNKDASVLINGLGLIRSLADKDDSNNSISQTIITICDDAIASYNTGKEDQDEINTDYLLKDYMNRSEEITTIGDKKFADWILQHYTITKK